MPLWLFQRAADHPLPIPASRRKKTAMRLVSFSLVIALSLLARGAKALELEQPTVRTNIRVERERYGSCSNVRAGTANAPTALNMKDVCHGWVATTCADKLLIVGQGVVEDQGQVLVESHARSVDTVRLVDAGIRARWPGHEHLNLSFGTPRCEQSTVVLPFSGSHQLIGASGPAAVLRGTLKVRSTRDQSVSLERVRVRQPPTADAGEVRMQDGRGSRPLGP